MTKKIIESFIKTVDPNKTTVVSFPDFIAIFGGALSSKKPRSRLKSNRDAFYWWISDNRPDFKELVLLPEKYNDWSDFSTYSDLLLFEKDLGYLTSAVIIFLESHGSIAELGAFSQIDSLSEKLIVVIADNHHPKKSFISLGPIRNIEITKKHENSVCVVPSGKPNKLTPHISIILDTLTKKRKRETKSKSFKSTEPLHEILLVLDLINLFLVSLKTELIDLAAVFNVNLNFSRINQILFLLEKVELITCQHYGDTQYFIPKNFKKIYFDYTSKSGERSFKRDRFKSLIWAEIQTDKFRKNAYEASQDRRK